MDINCLLSDAIFTLRLCGEVGLVRDDELARKVNSTLWLWTSAAAEKISAPPPLGGRVMRRLQLVRLAMEHAPDEVELELGLLMYDVWGRKHPRLGVTETL